MSAGEIQVCNVTAGAELLEKGRLYTVNGLTVRCLRHEPGRKPALKLSAIPVWLVHALSKATQKC